MLEPVAWLLFLNGYTDGGTGTGSSIWVVRGEIHVTDFVLLEFLSSRIHGPFLRFICVALKILVFSSILLLCLSSCFGPLPFVGHFPLYFVTVGSASPHGWLVT